MNSGFLQTDDRTLIICRSVKLDEDVYVRGHAVTELKSYDPNGVIYRKHVKGVKTVAEYEAAVKRLYSDIDKIRKAEYDRPKKINIVGRAHKKIGKTWNTQFFQHLSPYWFTGYTGLGEFGQVLKWVTDVCVEAGYQVIMDGYTVYDEVSNKKYSSYKQPN